MTGINKVILIGRLGRDPEVRRTTSGVAVANFSVATSERWVDKNSGEKHEITEWHKVVVWRKLAELCEKYLSKGRQVYIEGKMQTRSWDDKGITRYQTEVVANQLQFLGSSNDQAGSNEGYDELLKDGPPPQESQDNKSDDYENLPF